MVFRFRLLSIPECKKTFIDLLKIDINFSGKEGNAMISMSGLQRDSCLQIRLTVPLKSYLSEWHCYKEL